MIFFGYPQGFLSLSLVFISLNKMCLKSGLFICLFICLSIFFDIHPDWYSLPCPVSSTSGVSISHMLYHLMLIPVLKCPVLVSHLTSPHTFFFFKCFSLGNFCLLTCLLIHFFFSCLRSVDEPIKKFLHFFSVIVVCLGYFP